jgi:hypothetical protein
VGQKYGILVVEIRKAPAKDRVRGRGPGARTPWQRFHQPAGRTHPGGPFARERVTALPALLRSMWCARPRYAAPGTRRVCGSARTAGRSPTCLGMGPCTKHPVHPRLWWTRSATRPRQRRTTFCGNWMSRTSSSVHSLLCLRVAAALAQDGYQAVAVFRCHPMVQRALRSRHLYVGLV